MPPKKKSIANGKKKSLGGKKKSTTGKRTSSKKTSKLSIKKKSIKKGKRGSMKGGKRSSRKSKSVTDIFAELPEYNAENVRDALHEMDSAESPINLTLGILKKIKLPPINWFNFDTKAHAMKVSNTAYSVVVTGLWGESAKPYINGGPLLDDYEFSQIHFHWGQNNSEGSEHTVDGVQYPFELHAVFFKKAYGTHEKAKAEEDGIIVICYLYKVSVAPNMKLFPVTEILPSITNAYTDLPIDPVAIASLIKNVTDDYILYLGVMKYKCVHGVLWLICRDTMGISEIQLEVFRKLQDKYGNPMPKTYRDIQDLKNRNVFLVSPLDLKSVLHPFTDAMGRKSSRRSGSSSPSKKRKRKKSSKGSRKSSRSSKKKSIKKTSIKKKSIKKTSIKKTSIKGKGKKKKS